MLTNMLETDVTLYKAQFDQYMMAKYHNHIVDRLSLDLDGLKFRMGYMAKHNMDLDQIPLLKQQFIETSKQLRDIFSGFLYDFLTEYIGFPEECDYTDILDFYSTDMDLNQDTVTFQFSLLSDSTEYLEYVDQRVHEQKIFNMYPNQFFRFSTDSYNDARRTQSCLRIVTPRSGKEPTGMCSYTTSPSKQRRAVPYSVRTACQLERMS